MGMTEGMLLLAAAALFTTISVLILRKNRNYISMTFLLANVMFIISLVLLACSQITGENIFRVSGYFFFVIGPVFWFYSAYFIINGLDEWKSPLPVITAITIFLLAGINSLFLFLTDEDLYGTTGDVLVAAGIIMTFTYYYKVYRLIPELRPKVRLLLIGSFLGLAGLLGNAVYYFLTEQHSVFRQIIPTLGVIALMLAFMSLSDQKSMEQESRE
ncbi:MAG: hypothetical protein ACTSP4_16215 [Candidatus Hodarchaeales archaeon]